MLSDMAQLKNNVMSGEAKGFLLFMLMAFVFVLMLVTIQLHFKHLPYTVFNPEIINFKTECFRSKGRYEQIRIESGMLGVRCYDKNGLIIKQKEFKPYVTGK